MLERYKELEGEEGINVASTLNNMGIVKFNQNDYDFDEVKELFHRSLAIKRKVLGEEHRNLAFLYANLASLHSKTGKYKEALTYYEQALKIEERELVNASLVQGDATEGKEDKDKDKDKDKDIDEDMIRIRIRIRIRNSTQATIL